MRAAFRWPLAQRSSAYVQLFGAEVDKNAKAARIALADQTLRAAIAKSTPANATVLRYSLAIELLRDRAVNVPGAKAVAREVAFTVPFNDGYTGGAVNWLLDAATTDAEFNAEVASTVAARRQFPWISTYRATLAAWAQARLANKDLAARAKAAQLALAASDKEPINAQWIAYETAVRTEHLEPAIRRGPCCSHGPSPSRGLPGRSRGQPALSAAVLLSPLFAGRPADQDDRRCQGLGDAHAEVVRRRGRYSQCRDRLREARSLRDAAPIVLKLEPTSTSTDVSRRLFTVAVHFKDVALAQQTWAWSKKMFDKFGYDNNAASAMGDSLTALNLKVEAKECWDKALTGSPDTTDFSQSAYRLLALLPDPQKPAFLDTLIARDSGWNFSFARAGPTSW